MSEICDVCGHDAGPRPVVYVRGLYSGEISHKCRDCFSKLRVR